MKILFKTIIIILTFQTFAIATCDVKAKFGEKKEVLEQKEFIGRPFPLEYVGLEVYPILANDICPNEKLDDIAIEYRFLYDELVAINFVAINEPIWKRRVEFLKINPEGDLPVIVDEKDIKIIGYMSLAYYLDDSLLGE